MSIESKINYQLNKYPAVKKIIKRVYQRVMYVVSPKIKSEGDISRVSPDDPNHEYFFGYYDKSPWDITDRYMLCLKANDTWSDVSPKAPAEIILIDTQNNNKATHLARTHAWNVQQSCMLQWLGPDFKNRIIFNDCRDGKHCSVIIKLTFEGDAITVREEKVISAPVYSVSADGSFALTLDFSRLYNLRPGYGYYNVPEKTKGIALPDASAIWKVDLVTGEVSSVLKYSDFANFEPRPEMKEKGSVHKVNHIMLSPNGKRFMVLYRWFCGQRKYTRLITCNVDGSDMYVLSDDDMVSHCFWRTNSQIFAYENRKQGLKGDKAGNGYYLMKDHTQEYRRFWPGIDYDGHPSFSPDGSKVVFDRYPDRARVAAVMVSDAKNREDSGVQTIAKVFAPFKYDNDTRCDLHPRWNREGDKVCFDSVFEGHRGLYVVDVPQNEKSVVVDFDDTETDNAVERSDIKYSIITPVYNSFVLMNRYFDSLLQQTYKNFEVILVDDCSTDGSYEKLVEYQKTSPLNITLLKTKENSGPGNARNMGLEAASGDWITFIDNDDWVEISLLEKVNQVIYRNQVKCVIYDLYAQTEKEKNVIASMYAGNEGLISLSDALMFARNHSVGKFYCKANLDEKNIRFPLLRRCEDVAFCCRAIEACQSVYYLKEPLYYYYQRTSSLSNNAKMDQGDMVEAFKIVEDTLGKKYAEAVEAKSVTDLLYGGVLMMCKAHKSSLEIKEYIKAYERKYPNWRHSRILDSLGGGKALFLKFSEKKAIPMLRLMTLAHSLLIGK
ncbi:MAG: glycosyltransferase [Eubacteriales bacterium]|nr:glycosyltransferase [Eubacteriales bacterium]